MGRCPKRMPPDYGRLGQKLGMRNELEKVGASAGNYGRFGAALRRELLPEAPQVATGGLREEALVCADGGEVGGHGGKVSKVGSIKDDVHVTASLHYRAVANATTVKLTLPISRRRPTRSRWYHVLGIFLVADANHQRRSRRLRRRRLLQCVSAARDRFPRLALRAGVALPQRRLLRGALPRRPRHGRCARPPPDLAAPKRCSGYVSRRSPRSPTG